MKSIFKIVLWFEVLNLNLAVFENPFKLQALFGKMFEIDSKIHQIMDVRDINLKAVQERIFMFRQEIQITSKLMGHEKYPRPPKARGYLG